MSDLNEEFEAIFSGVDDAVDEASMHTDEGDPTALGGMYTGSSDGFRRLVEGYSEYATTTIADRAVPDARDGLKPVQRRILFAMCRGGKQYRSAIGSVTAVGDTIKWHPHGDSAVYEAAVRMTDNNGSFMIPLLHGSGNTGSVNAPGTQAASRYTKMWLHEVNAQDYLRDMNGCIMTPAEIDETQEEPEFLPVRYPAVLCNTAMGIAVGMATNIPAFNFFDVVNLTIAYLKGEDISHTVMVPDFPTGGFVLKDDKEFLRILNTGKGRVRIRAKVEINEDSSEISVKEIPFGKTLDSIKNSIDRIINPPKDVTVEGIPGLRAVNDYSDYHGVNIEISTDKGMAERVLLHLYKRGILQTNFGANLNVVNGSRPLFGGVVPILDAWYKSREVVMKRVFLSRLDVLKSQYVLYDYFLRLVSNPEWKEQYLNRITEVSIAEADTYLRGIFQDIPEDVVKWIHERRAAEFNKGGKYRGLMDNVRTEATETRNNLDNLRQWVIKDLEALKAEHAGMHKRVSEITNKDYKFIKVDQMSRKERENVEDIPAWFTVTDRGFFYKTMDATNSVVGNIIFQKCLSSRDTLVGFDNYGNILRVYGDQIPMDSVRVNLMDYFEIPAEQRLDRPDRPGYSIPFMTNLDGGKIYVFYTNGKVSIIDTEKYIGKSVRRRVVKNGLNGDLDNELLEVFTEDNLPEVMLFVDDASARGYKMAWERTDAIRETSSPAAQVRFVGLKHIMAWYGDTQEGIEKLFASAIEGSESGAANEVGLVPDADKASALMGRYHGNGLIMRDNDMLGILAEPCVESRFAGR